MRARLPSLYVSLCILHLFCSSGKSAFSIAWIDDCAQCAYFHYDGLAITMMALKAYCCHAMLAVRGLVQLFRSVFSARSLFCTYECRDFVFHEASQKIWYCAFPYVLQCDACLSALLSGSKICVLNRFEVLLLCVCPGLSSQWYVFRVRFHWPTIWQGVQAEPKQALRFQRVFDVKVFQEESHTPSVGHAEHVPTSDVTLSIISC